MVRLKSTYFPKNGRHSVRFLPSQLGHPYIWWCNHYWRKCVVFHGGGHGEGEEHISLSHWQKDTLKARCSGMYLKINNHCTIHCSCQMQLTNSFKLPRTGGIFCHFLPVPKVGNPFLQWIKSFVSPTESKSKRLWNECKWELGYGCTMEIYGINSHWGQSSCTLL